MIIREISILNKLIKFTIDNNNRFNTVRTNSKGSFQMIEMRKSKEKDFMITIIGEIMRKLCTRGSITILMTNSEMIII